MLPVAQANLHLSSHDDDKSKFLAYSKNLNLRVLFIKYVVLLTLEVIHAV